MTVAIVAVTLFWCNISKSNMISEIKLHDVLPNVFSDLEIKSQVWKQNVVFQKGKKYMIEAASGTGKTSLCRFIYGSRFDYSGSILFDDIDIKNYSIDEWSKNRTQHLAFLQQDMRLFGELSVMDNIMIKNKLTDYKTHREVVDMLQQIELDHKVNTLSMQLSLGQQQRVAIIRALCQPFSFLILDEPVSHLDEYTNNLVSSLVKSEITLREAGLIVTSVGNIMNIDFDNILAL